MARRSGLRVELLVSLGVVLLMATALLGAIVVTTHELSVQRLQRLAARALLEDARSPLPPEAGNVPELRWWIVEASGAARPRGHREALDDPVLRELAETAARQRQVLLRAGAPWEPIRFAAPSGAGVAVAALPAAIPAGLVLALLLGDVVIVTALAAYLLRRRLVTPLERLAAAARAIGDGDLGMRAPVEGPRETAEVGAAFNDMTDALAGRSAELEKAVVDLRESNQSLREAREGLDRAARLAAVGRLAAGVAHEVGNPMGAMLAFVDLVRRDPGLSDQSRRHLERAGEEGQRVRGILRQLLDFSRPPRLELGPVDVGRVCEETAELVRAQRRYAGIEIAVESEAEAPPARAERNTLVQILLNLLLNAGDALHEAGTPGARVVVTVRASALQTRRGEGRDRAAERARADAVECVVRDNGPGVAPEDRERIFDPFFTTKDPGEGTGLGLANAVRLAEEFGGSLELDADAGPGAAFVLRLPAHGATAPPAALRRG